MRAFVIATVVLGVLVWMPVAPAEEAAAEGGSDAVVKAVMEQWSKLNSMTANIDADAKLPAGETTTDIVGKGTMAYLKKGDKVMSRLEMSARMAQSTSDMDLANVLVVYDGEKAAVQYKVIGRMQYRALPVEDADVAGADGQIVLDLLGKYFALKALPEEKIGEDEVYVLEGTPTFELPSDAPLQGVKVCFAKATGVPLKLVVYHTDGSVLLDMRFKDIKVNPEIGEDRFVVPSPPPEPAPATPVAPPAEGEGK